MVECIQRIKQLGCIKKKPDRYFEWQTDYFLYTLLPQKIVNNSKCQHDLWCDECPTGQAMENVTITRCSTNKIL